MKARVLPAVADDIIKKKATKKAGTMLKTEAHMYPAKNVIIEIGARPIMERVAARA